MIIAQQRHHVFRVGTFGETGETPQIAEERRDLPPMALQLLLCSRRDNQIGHLRGQETSKPTHTFYFADLISDTLFQMPV